MMRNYRFAGRTETGKYSDPLLQELEFPDERGDCCSGTRTDKSRRIEVGRQAGRNARKAGPVTGSESFAGKGYRLYGYLGESSAMQISSVKRLNSSVTFLVSRFPNTNLNGEKSTMSFLVNNFQSVTYFVTVAKKNGNANRYRC